MQVLSEHVVMALEELSDEETQRRLWLSTGESGAEVSSFVECVCRLFDDSGLGDELDRGRTVYGQSLDDDLRALQAALGRIDGERPAREIIADPVLTELRPVAQHLADAIPSPDHSRLG